MTHSVVITDIHHITLTVSDVDISETFYTRHFGFVTRVDRGSRKILHNGAVMLVLTLPADANAPVPENDRFSENRIGLDHLSFSIASRADMEAAATYFDEQGITRGEIHDLGSATGIYVMAFRDPDNIQLELTSPR